MSIVENWTKRYMGTLYTIYAPSMSLYFKIRKIFWKVYKDVDCQKCLSHIIPQSTMAANFLHILIERSSTYILITTLWLFKEVKYVRSSKFILTPEAFCGEASVTIKWKWWSQEHIWKKICPRNHNLTLYKNTKKNQSSLLL